jgi:hypothetical protein
MMLPMALDSIHLLWTPMIRKAELNEDASTTASLQCGLDPHSLPEEPRATAVDTMLNILRVNTFCLFQS